MIKLSKRVKKDLNKRLKYNRISNKTFILKSLMKNEQLPINLRHYARYKLAKQAKAISIAKVNKYCVLSNNFRSVLTQFKLSRRYLKEYAGFGKINGLFKK